MLRNIIFLSTILLLASCEPKRPNNNNLSTSDSSLVDSLAIVNDPSNVLKIQGMDIIEIDSSGIMMIPLALKTEETNANSYDSYSSRNNRFWNIVFWNSNTNEYHLLTDQKMVMSTESQSLNTHYGNDGQISFSVKPSKYLFYSVVSNDFNKDKSLNKDDPQYLFVSDKEGKNFRQISPVNYSLVRWHFIQKTNKVLLTLREDSDKNNKFESDDELVIYEVDLNKETEAREVLSTDFKRKLKVMYGSQWKNEANK